MAKLYTRKGDAGETSLFSGERVPKEEPRMEALGAIDELVAALGAAKAEVYGPEPRDRLTAIQSELYLLMAGLASSDDGRERSPPAALPADAVDELEAAIDAIDARLPPLTDFVMPGESRGSALMHVARTVCRRAERRVVAVARVSTGGNDAVVYLNRLADLLFALARAVDHDAGHDDKTFKSAL